jgi:hypothetical protein
MWSATGLLESLHARALAPRNPGEKAASPAGAEIRGLVMANTLGRRMLEGSTLGDWSPAAETVASVGLWVAEGLPDFLTLATNWSDGDAGAPAVLGVVSGSWTETLAARVPDGCEVVIATDPDSAGEKYADRIVATFAERMRTGRLRVGRWTSKLGRTA